MGHHTARRDVAPACCCVLRVTSSATSAAAATSSCSSAFRSAMHRGQRHQKRAGGSQKGGTRSAGSNTLGMQWGLEAMREQGAGRRLPTAAASPCRCCCPDVARVAAPGLGPVPPSSPCCCPPTFQLLLLRVQLARQRRRLPLLCLCLLAQLGRLGVAGVGLGGRALRACRGAGAGWVPRWRLEDPAPARDPTNRVFLKQPSSIPHSAAQNCHSNLSRELQA